MQSKYKNICQRVIYIDPETKERIKKDKKKFGSLEDAIIEAKRINALKINIHKVVAYKCNFCFKYHIGKNKTLLK